ncbi:MAG: DUF1493 family protein [Bacteroidota bacterium]
MDIGMSMTQNDKVVKNKDSNIWFTIKGLAIDFNGPYKFELTRNTKIEEELHITGDCANEFLEKFVEIFEVNHDGFEAAKYFDAEGFDPLGISILIWKIMGWKRVKKSNHELTLGDLENWVIRGYWLNPEDELA